LALAKKGVLTGMSIKLLWLQTTTAFSNPSKIDFPVTLNVTPTKNKNRPIQILDINRWYLVFCGSGIKKHTK
jgi:hypothetical protein